MRRKKRISLSMSKSGWLLGLYLGASVAIFLSTAYFMGENCKLTLKYFGENDVEPSCNVGVE
jgi:hypothetical protein